MTVRELIRDLLYECGKEKRAAQIFKELEDNERAELEIGCDIGADSIRYVEDMFCEFPCYMGLACER